MTSSAHAELSAIADQLERYRERVVALVPGLRGGNHDDVIAALFEAERSLRSAGRAVDRAERLLG
ncbi:MAG: hypothetical protein RI958_948 [Actinomycetota bacterium]|jgi:hypothetical protein